MSATLRLANPRRTTLALLTRGDGPLTCEGNEGSTCHNLVTQVVETAEGTRRQCRSCSDR
ncbi:MAG: hypothetical protein JWN57_881 [Frankiales bacterium]|jgi:hypothetical protein|nr:hypothetical protein [Frankiales bacterium]